MYINVELQNTSHELDWFSDVTFSMKFMINVVPRNLMNFWKKRSGFQVIQQFKMTEKQTVIKTTGQPPYLESLNTNETD